MLLWSYPTAYAPRRLSAVAGQQKHGPWNGYDRRDVSGSAGLVLLYNVRWASVLRVLMRVTVVMWRTSRGRTRCVWSQLHQRHWRPGHGQRPTLGSTVPCAPRDTTRSTLERSSLAAMSSTLRASGNGCVWWGVGTTPCDPADRTTLVPCVARRTCQPLSQPSLARRQLNLLYRRTSPHHTDPAHPLYLPMLWRLQGLRLSPKLTPTPPLLCLCPRQPTWRHKTQRRL
mmetsp:Transcript_43703/g.94853  ORF Transcript_43703/g.94853 Transcript_43703/m.94853 type:complete len:228 (-) Transcript_43703:324-1007(-)